MKTNNLLANHLENKNSVVAFNDFMFTKGWELGYTNVGDPLLDGKSISILKREDLGMIILAANKDRMCTYYIGADTATKEETIPEALLAATEQNIRMVDGYCIIGDDVDPSEFLEEVNPLAAIIPSTINFQHKMNVCASGAMIYYTVADGNYLLWLDGYLSEDLVFGWMIENGNYDADFEATSITEAIINTLNEEGASIGPHVLTTNYGEHNWCIQSHRFGSVPRGKIKAIFNTLMANHS